MNPEGGNNTRINSSLDFKVDPSIPARVNSVRDTGFNGTAVTPSAALSKTREVAGDLIYSNLCSSQRDQNGMIIGRRGANVDHLFKTFVPNKETATLEDEDFEPEIHGLPARQIIIASGIAGGLCQFFADAMMFPLDSIKTRLQASNAERNFVRGAENVSKYSGFSMIFSAFPSGITYFSTYEAIKSVWSSIPILSQYETARNSFAGAMSEVSQNLVVNPFEIIKQNMQIGLSRTLLGSMREIYRVRGISGFYVGYLSLMLREMPFSATQMPLYEIFREKAKKRTGKKKLAPWENGLNGAMAAGIAGMLTTPVDVIKTKMMTQQGKKYKNTWDCTKQVWRNEGPLKFLSGAHLRVFSVSSAFFVFFSLYESVRHTVLESMDSRY
jgi:solute carrier family 25 S-adenosylmethionine transporter 26